MQNAQKVIALVIRKHISLRKPGYSQTCRSDVHKNAFSVKISVLIKIYN